MTSPAADAGQRMRRSHISREWKGCPDAVLKQFGGGQQVPTGEAEPGHVHHDRGIGRNGRLPVEHVDAVERGPVLG